MTHSLCTLKKPRDFKTVLSKGKRWVTPSFILISSPFEPLHAKSDTVFGVIASKKVGNSVARSRAKRRLREVIRETLPPVAEPKHTYIFIARKSILEHPFEQLLKDAKWALRKITQ